MCHLNYHHYHHAVYSAPCILSISGGVFTQRAHSANYYVNYPRNNPENHPPTEACMIHSKQHRRCRIQDPGTRGKHQTKTKNPWCTGRGCRVQNSGPRDPWLHVVKNSRVFAQRGHSARCAPSYTPILECEWLSYHYHMNMALFSRSIFFLTQGECLPGACPARYLCIKYLISGPKFILTLGSSPSRPH